MGQVGRRQFLVVAGAIAMHPRWAPAQQAKRVARVAILFESGLAAAKHLLDAFKEEMARSGWREGVNVEYVFREGRNDPERIEQLIVELVAQKPDVIIAPTTRVAVAARKHTARIPIVFSIVPFPAKAGLVESYARPGGNATGTTAILEGVRGKRLQLFKEMIPSMKRVAVLYDPSSVQEAGLPEATQVAGAQLAIDVQPFTVSQPEDFRATFAAVRRANADAVVLGVASLFFIHRKLLADLAIEHRMPSVTTTTEGVEAGLLFCYQPSLSGLLRQAARYADRILNGAEPMNLPVEQPLTLDFWINAKTAKVLGLAIPRSILLRADRIIE